MPRDTVLTWPDYLEEPTRRFDTLPRRARDYDDYLGHYYYQNRGEMLPPKPGAPGHAAIAFVDAGRWIWQCAACRSAMPVQEARPSICVGCGFGGWADVLWPVNKTSIEEELLRQPGHRYMAPLRRWRPWMTDSYLQARTARAYELLKENPDTLLRSLSIGATRVWVIGEILSAANMNLYISDVLDDLSGDNGIILLRNSAQAPGLIVTGGTTLERPTSAAGLIRWNTDNETFDLGLGADNWKQMLNSGAVTAAHLIANNGLGQGDSQGAFGDHTHAPTLAPDDDITGSLTYPNSRDHNVLADSVYVFGGSGGGSPGIGILIANYAGVDYTFFEDFSGGRAAAGFQVIADGTVTIRYNANHFQHSGAGRYMGVRVVL